VLVYASKYYEHRPWQRAFRRAAKLRRRLGITGMGAPEKPKEMRMRTYARLLEETLEAETQATEAGTARLQELAAGTGNRRKPPSPKLLFTLD
jgi:hypothetical protein